jgi:hypothetical protein
VARFEVNVAPSKLTLPARDHHGPAGNGAVPLERRSREPEVPLLDAIARRPNEHRAATSHRRVVRKRRADHEHILSGPTRRTEGDTPVTLTDQVRA